ncbi:hypothetical protein F4809DRAFT_329542 [Biscogniauxia mediterranea]|nr:hypothetical protein F4809DRAFT_329542 [Biscogniauxia mediterranea]
MPEYVRITSSGRPQFVRSHSFSHHLHHHHRTRYVPRCPEHCAAVTVEQWDSLVDQNKGLADGNAALTREKESLKAELHASGQELGRLRDTNARLDGEVHELRRRRSGGSSDELDRFRRRVAALKHEVDERDAAVARLERDVGVLNVRVRELSRTVDLKDAEIAAALADRKRWRRRCDDLERRYNNNNERDRDRDLAPPLLPDNCHKKVIIEEQRRVRRRDPCAPRRQWVTFA